MKSKWTKWAVGVVVSVAAIALAFGAVACVGAPGGGSSGMGCCGDRTPAPAAGGAPAESGSQKSAEAATVKVVPQSVANAKCPIMGGKVDPKAPEGLTRIYKGQKIGFCCGGCPAAWDKLTDAQKDAKLQSVVKAG